MSLVLEDLDQAALAGARGEAARLAMEIIVAYAEMTGATRLIDVNSAHIDACLHHGLAGVEFAEKLRDLGGRVSIPSTLNVSSLDLLHPDLYRGDPETKDEAKRMMTAYVDMGCAETWTCAPYQLPSRPSFGEHVAWAESNAIVFANSVLGARTGRYGDFFDIAAALTGRVPYTGLHLDENRRARVVYDLTSLSTPILYSDMLFSLLGLLIGQTTTEIPAIVGLPRDTTEDDLKSLGAAGASSGALAMFHAVGLTPEAPTLEAALGGEKPQSEVEVTPGMLLKVLDDLGRGTGSELVGISVGTPHFSLDELRQTAAQFGGRRVAEGIDFFASTGRDVYRLAEDEGLVSRLEDAGVEIVVDTCTYVTPILRELSGTVMTNSGKWAYYAPGNLGVDVIFGSLADCVESAIAGAIERDTSEWRGA